MGYSAVNLGKNDFRFGSSFLKQIINDIKLPLITSNIVYKKTKKPFGQKYYILKAGKMNIGVVGIISQNGFDNLPNPKTVADLEILSPEKELKSLLPELKKKTDFVILLSQSSYNATDRLIKSVGSIDLAILGRKIKFLIM